MNRSPLSGAPVVDLDDRENDVAVVGMACRLPGARDAAELWRNLCAGVEAISFFSEDELREAGVSPGALRDPAFVPAYGAIPEAWCFDAPFFGVSRREAQALTDPTTLLEHFGRLEGVSVLYCGEGNRTAAALALAVSRVPGMRLLLATPAGYGLDPRVAVHGAVARRGVRRDRRGDARPRRGAAGVRRVGKADPGWRTRFAPFRVTRALMERVGGRGAVFMHDLPAVRGEDVDDAVLDGPRSLAWVQAQHKMFSAMTVMEWCGAGPPPSPPDGRPERHVLAWR